MGKTYNQIDSAMREFVGRQQLFFVATAPVGNDGHINCSPKGLDSFRILGPAAVAYVDYTGSGAETIAHLRENGRIVIMFCAFEGPPKIVRLHGRGTVIEPSHPEFDELLARFGPQPSGVRSIIRVDVERVSDSCGFGVPVMKFERERTQLPAWAEKKGAEGLEDYKRRKNAESIDGIPTHLATRPLP
jgi:Pyridoxamine 5'-phosphate oxidase